MDVDDAEGEAIVEPLEEASTGAATSCAAQDDPEMFSSGCSPDMTNSECDADSVPTVRGNCCVPGCGATYRGSSEGTKSSLFAVPKCPIQREKWEHNLRLPRGYMKSSSAVCEAHFKPHHVLRDFVHIVNGKDVRLPRDRPKLAEGAVPVLSGKQLPDGGAQERNLPRDPQHFKQDTPEPSTAQREEKKRSSSAASLTDRHAKCVKSAARPMMDCSLETQCGNINEERRALLALTTPSTSRWTTLQFPNVDRVFYVTSRLIPPSEIYHDRVRFLKQEEDGLLCRTYVNGSPYGEKRGISFAQAEEGIIEICGSFLCLGTVRKDELNDGPLQTTVYGRNLSCHGKAFYSTSCEGVVPDVEWESHARGMRGFMSQSTAARFRVTIKSTLLLLEYLTTEVSYAYRMTARLNQDPMESTFGIVRQCSGNNDLTPQQFLYTMACISFCDLVHSPEKGNVLPDTLDSLLSPALYPPSPLQNTGFTHALGEVQFVGNEDDMLDDVVTHESHHEAHMSARSDRRLVHYISGPRIPTLRFPPTHRASVFISVRCDSPEAFVIKDNPKGRKTKR
ncbi:hypothetical protein MTO96_018043 [Rhipicephalus appendiculatus]